MTCRSIALGTTFALLLAGCSAPTTSPSLAQIASTTPISTQSESSAATPSVASIPAAATWRQLTVSGDLPAAREDHTWTITPDASTAYLFGGRDGATVYDDLWAFDLAADAWSRVTPAGDGPPPRFGHNAVWAPGIGLVVFAGQGEVGFFNDLWAFDPAANLWRQLDSGGAVPVARYGSCATIGPDGRVWISHGFTSEGQRFADTLAYDFTAGTWTDETPAGDAPIRRCLHACWWTDDGELALYAGQTTGVTALGDLWRLTLGPRPGTNSWSQLQPIGGLPPDRNLYATARWGGGTLVFGGQAVDGSYLADSWWLADDGAAATEVAVSGVSPPPRAGAEWIADPGRGRLLLFGGRSGPTAFDDLWEMALPTR